MKFPVVVVLDDIRSVLNVGAIFRTCDGAGISHLYLSGITPHPPHPKLLKTALGATDMMPWSVFNDKQELINKLKGEGYQLIVVEQTTNSQQYTKVNYNFPIALVFGNEITGVSPEFINASDIAMELPMYGDKNSLNVATTCGIICYHVVNEYQNVNS